MSYFQNLPKIFYDLRNTPQAPIVVTNILARAHLRKLVSDGLVVYYSYDVKDAETPEIVASKYYGDPNRHWIVLFANDIVNPYYDWPLSYSAFQDYITVKYGSISNAQSNVGAYLITTTKTLSSNVYGSPSANLSVTTDANTWANVVTGTTVVNLPNNATVSVVVSKSSISVYDLEYNQNESKRTIKLVDKSYVPQLEKELEALFVTG